MLNNVPLKSNMQQTSINNKTHLRFFFVRFVLPLWFTLLGLLLLFFLLLILSFLFLLAPLLLFPLFFFRARILPKRKWTKLIFRAKISRSHLGYLLSKCNEWRRAYCRRKLIKKTYLVGFFRRRSLLLLFLSFLLFGSGFGTRFRIRLGTRVFRGWRRFSFLLRFKKKSIDAEKVCLKMSNIYLLERCRRGLSLSGRLFNRQFSFHFFAFILPNITLRVRTMWLRPYSINASNQ